MKNTSTADTEMLIVSAYHAAADECERNKEVPEDRQDLNRGTVAVDHHESMEEAAQAIRELAPEVARQTQKSAMATAARMGMLRAAAICEAFGDEKDIGAMRGDQAAACRFMAERILAAMADDEILTSPAVEQIRAEERHRAAVRLCEVLESHGVQDDALTRALVGAVNSLPLGDGH